MIKRFAQCLREYKWTALVSPVCMIGEVAMEVTIPLVMADLYDYGIAMSNMTVVWQKALQLLLCALASLLFGCLSADYASKAATGFARNLRHDMYYRVQDFSFSNIDKFSSASIVTRLTSDVATIQMAFQMMIRMAIRCPMMLILATVSSLRISPKLSTVYFIAIPLLALVLLGIIPLVFRIFDRVFKTYDRLNTVVQENVHGIRVVKSFANEEVEQEKFSRGNKGFLDAKKNSYLFMGGYQAGLTAFTTLITVVVVIAGALWIPGGSVSITDLITFLLYINVFTEPVKTLIDFTEQFQNGYSGFERFMEILSIEPDISDEENAIAMENVRGEVEFQDVSFRYEEHLSRVLRHINLKVPAGSYVALVGTSGAGKTTLCSLIPRFYDVSEGRILIDGCDIRHYKLKSLRDHIGIVQQDVYLFAGTIFENIAYGKPDATRQQVIGIGDGRTDHARTLYGSK